MDKNDFIWFIEEREMIRQKKEARLTSPWTEDPILDKCHFMNIRSQDDPATKRLVDFVSRMTEWEKLFYIFVYRTLYSSPTLLSEMTKFWMHDYRNIRILNIGLEIKKHPYNIPKGMYKSLKKYLVRISLPVLKEFWLSFDELNIASIYDIETRLMNLFISKSGRRTELLSSIIANDISLVFPDKVDPDSECYLCLTTKQALRKIGYKRYLKHMDNLCAETGLNHYSLNRALTLWNTYLKRKAFYEEMNAFKEDWLIQA